MGLLAFVFPKSASKAGPSRLAENKSSHLRGINLYPWFCKPAIKGKWDRSAKGAWKYAWPPFRMYTPNSYKRELRALRKTGMNFLRVPILAGPFMQLQRPQRLIALKNIAVVMRTALNMGFTLMIEYHTSSPGIGEYKRVVASAKTRAHYFEAFEDLYAVFAPLSKR